MSRNNCAIGRDIGPASFKGVPFLCVETSLEGGRRGAEGEFPFAEITAYADLGRKIRVYSMSAVFREDNHIGDSQALFNACESPGPGLLVHPTRGIVNVACRSIKVRDPLEEGVGETFVDLEFVEANGIPGLGGLLFGIINSGLNAASKASFTARYQPLLISQPWRADVVHTAQRLVNAVSRVTTQTMTKDSPTQVWRDVLRMQSVGQDDALASYADNVDDALQTGFTTTQSNVVDPAIEYRTMRRLANEASGAAKSSVGHVSEEAVLSRHRVLAAIGMAEAAMAVEYPQINDALTAMDQTLVVLNDEARIAYENCDNELYLNIKDYARQFEHMMNDLAYNLPGQVIVDFMGGVHPLVASYVIYNDAKRHRDLEQRNMVDANGRFRSVVAALQDV